MPNEKELNAKPESGAVAEAENAAGGTAQDAGTAVATPAAGETAAGAGAVEGGEKEIVFAPDPEDEKPRKKKRRMPIGLRILLWIGIIALVIFLTLFIVAMIVPDERINSISDLISYIVTEFRAL